MSWRAATVDDLLNVLDEKPGDWKIRHRGCDPGTFDWMGSSTDICCKSCQAVFDLGWMGNPASVAFTGTKEWVVEHFEFFDVKVGEAIWKMVHHPDGYSFTRLATPEEADKYWRDD